MTDGFSFKVYAGSAGALRDLELMREEGIGRMVVATDWKNPKPGIDWCLDNGAFAAYRKGEPFPEEDFLNALEKIPDEHPPEFVVVPDKVAAGKESLYFSRDWLPRLPSDLHLYLPVQDGMRLRHVVAIADEIEGIFIGGSERWKWRTAAEWVDLARDLGLGVHIGRCPRVQHLVAADRVGADSVDSTTWPRNDAWHILDGARAQTRLEVCPP